jgi:putative FmdB family regulatory protein
MDDVSFMPIYEYICDSCGQIVEALQRLSDPPLEDCPSGDGGKLSKALSAHNVGGLATGAEAAACESFAGPACGGCERAGTGCS